MRCTKYGGFSRGREPNRPSKDNPKTNSAKFPTVKDCKERIEEYKTLLKSQEYTGAVKDYLLLEIKKLEKLIKEAVKL